jgi:prepilin-type N-terminal cleavage/methylation domain-containing protein
MFKKLMKKLMKEETGFTLIELLVTIAILGVLFGIVTLTLTGVGTNASTTSHTAEAAVVQSAADIWLAATPGNSLSAATPAYLDPSSTSVPFGEYLRAAPGKTTTECQYGWDANGNVSQGTCP